MSDSMLSSISNLLPFGMDGTFFLFDDEYRSLPSIWVWMGLLLGGYLLSELVFVLWVYKVRLPELNKPKDHPIIRKFEDPNIRHKLFERMLRRQEVLCEALDIDKKPYFAEFIRNWFFHGGDREDYDAEEELACIKETGLPCKADIDSLIAWGFFQCKASDLTEEWQQRELAKMYAMIKETYNMEPGPKTKQRLIPVQMTVEDVDIRYRPLFVYLMNYICQIFMAGLLYWQGFSHYTTSTGLGYWYRPAPRPSEQQLQPLPFVFFHGIAPAGETFYVPMITGGLGAVEGLATDEKGNIDRPIFLFQNPAVAFNLTNHAPTEQETCDGVWEAVDKHLGPTAEVSLSGHSFGTCLETYILHSTQAHRVRQMIMIDPVAICLSDPDVITNFVYGRSHHRDTKLHDSVMEPGAASWVMNELFIEHFLRRQFAWYNGELFLEDIPDHCKLVVCLSDTDEICNAQKIKAHLDIYNGNTPNVPRCMKHLRKQDKSSIPTTTPLSSHPSNASSTGSLGESANRQKIDVIYWEGEGIDHGSCLFNPSTWRQIRRMMRKQELQIFKEKSL